MANTRKENIAEVIRLSPTVYRSMRLVAETPEKWNTGE